MSLKERLFRRYMRQHPQRQSHFPHWEKVKSVCLLYQSNAGNSQDISACCDLLKKAGKQVQIVRFVDAKQTDNQERGISVCRKDFNCFGRPSKSLLASLPGQTDLLIDLSEQPLLPLRYMAFCINADFKAGRKLSLSDEDGIHHLLIQTDNCGTLFVFQQIMHYLTTIHSNY